MIARISDCQVLHHLFHYVYEQKISDGIVASIVTQTNEYGGEV
jgi:hypothetical protein